MSRAEAGKLRSRGEAHLYVAVAKADGIVSEMERVRAPYYAFKSQDVLDVLEINQATRSRIKQDINHLLTARSFAAWSAEQHLDAAVDLLDQAGKAGDWGAQLTVHRTEHGLERVALLDGYILKESKFLRRIKHRLAAFVE